MGEKEEIGYNDKMRQKDKRLAVEWIIRTIV